jgi:hypothetical protein
MVEDTGYLPAKSSHSDSPPLPTHTRLVSELVRRLLSHYWTLDDHPAMRREQGADWIEDLVELPAECIEEACREWRRTQPDKRPMPGHIRILAIAEQRRRNPPAEPEYLPEPRPRMADPVERAEMARRMGELARIVSAGLEPDVS